MSCHCDGAHDNLGHAALFDHVGELLDLLALLLDARLVALHLRRRCRQLVFGLLDLGRLLRRGCAFFKHLDNLAADTNREAHLREVILEFLRCHRLHHRELELLFDKSRLKMREIDAREEHVQVVALEV